MTQVSQRQHWRTHTDNGNAIFDSTLAGNLIVAEEPAGGVGFLRQLKGESRTAAEVVMDDALVQDDGIEFDRGRTGPMLGGYARPRQSVVDREGPLRDTKGRQKMETTFMFHVARRKLNFQQLDKALGMPLPAVIKGYATLRDAKLAESSYDKVVTWDRWQLPLQRCGAGTVRLDRPEMRPGTSGQSGKTVPTHFTDPEVDAPTIVPGPRFGHNQVWTEPTGTRFSTHCKRTSISARTERRRSNAMERSPSRAFLT